MGILTSAKVGLSVLIVMVSPSLVCGLYSGGTVIDKRKAMPGWVSDKVSLTRGLEQGGSVTFSGFEPLLRMMKSRSMLTVRPAGRIIRLGMTSTSWTR